MVLVSGACLLYNPTVCITGAAAAVSDLFREALGHLPIDEHREAREGNDDGRDHGQQELGRDAADLEEADHASSLQPSEPPGPEHGRAGLPR